MVLQLSMLALMGISFDDDCRVILLLTVAAFRSASMLAH